MAISVGKIGPRISPPATTIVAVSQAARLSTIPSVNAMHKAAIAITSTVFMPSGKVNAVISRDPMNVSQNIDSSVEASASLIPFAVINVVAHVAVEASIGTWKKNARQHSHTIGSASSIASPPATDSLAGDVSLSQFTPRPSAIGTTANAASTRNVRSSRIARINTATRIGVTNAPRPNTKSPMFIAYAMRRGMSSGGRKAGGEVTLRTLTSADQPDPSASTAIIAVA